MTSSDKDFRFMATNDLMGELQKDSIKLDDDSEKKVCLFFFFFFFPLYFSLSLFTLKNLVFIKIGFV